MGPHADHTHAAFYLILVKEQRFDERQIGPSFSPLAMTCLSSLDARIAKWPYRETPDATD